MKEEDRGGTDKVMVRRERNLISNVPKRTISQGQEILSIAFGNGSAERSWWQETKAMRDQRGENTMTTF